jgi:hypothetical protein
VTKSKVQAGAVTVNAFKFGQKRRVIVVYIVINLKVRSEALIGVSALFGGVFNGPAACLATYKAPFVIGFAIFIVSFAAIATAITAFGFAAVIAAESIVSVVTFVYIIGVFFMAEFAVEFIRIIIDSQLFSLAAFPNTNSGSEL